MKRGKSSNWVHWLYAVLIGTSTSIESCANDSSPLSCRADGAIFFFSQ
jgi:hypothetical protein